MNSSCVARPLSEFISIPQNLQVFNTLGSNRIYSVAVSASTIYAATGGGLSISNDNCNTWLTKTTVDGLGANSVFSVVASSATVYAGTFGGGLSISYDSGSTWITKTTADGLGANDVRTIVATGSTIYVGTANGLSRSR